MNFPEHEERLGKALGPSKGIGDEMCRWILQPSGEVIARCAARPLTISGEHVKVEEEKNKLFLRILYERIGISQKSSGSGVPWNRKANVEPYEDDDESSEPDPKIEVNVDNNKEVNHQAYYDTLIHNEVNLQRDNLIQSRKFKGRTPTSNGSIIGTCNDNPNFNTLTHDVDLKAEVLKNMWTQ